MPKFGEKPLVTFTVQEQECPGCGETFKVNTQHLRDCALYQERQAELVKDWEDENGIWWTYDHEEGDWIRRS